MPVRIGNQTVADDHFPQRKLRVMYAKSLASFYKMSEIAFAFRFSNASLIPNLLVGKLVEAFVDKILVAEIAFVGGY